MDLASISGFRQTRQRNVGEIQQVIQNKKPAKAGFFKRLLIDAILLSQQILRTLLDFQLPFEKALCDQLRYSLLLTLR